MTAIPRRVLVASAVFGLAALGLAACATPAPGSSGTPEASTPEPEGAELDAAWLDDGRAVGIVTLGSSSCVPIAEASSYDAGTSTLTVELVDVEGQACTRDLVARGTLVPLPAGVDPTKDLEIVVTGAYAGDTDLDGDAGLTGAPGDASDFQPSAGRFDDEGFLILSWGSSSCAPVLEFAEMTGPGEVTATFETPAADRPCTMDMAPRITVAHIEEVDEDSVLLSLTGGEFDGVTVRVAGGS